MPHYMLPRLASQSQLVQITSSLRVQGPPCTPSLANGVRSSAFIGSPSSRTGTRLPCINDAGHGNGRCKMH